MDKEFLGNYKIIKKIGEGGMAIAYMAHHKQIEEHRVVLKILKDPRHGEKFKKEANNLARLNDNNNICRIFDFFNDEDRTVIVMEYIEGATLKDVLESEKQLPLNLTLKLGVDLLRVMKYAHNRKMYHRDIKPGNLMVDKQGELKVIDFGIAKDATDPNETAAGVFSGTPMYAPIEQFDPMRRVDWAKADIYAIGTTIYRMLTGRMPFDGDNWDDYSDNKRLSEPHPPSDFNKEVSKELDKVLLKSIARLPEDRYDNVEEMLKQIEGLRSETITSADVLEQTIDVQRDPEETYDTGSQRVVVPQQPPPQQEKKKSKMMLIIGSIAVMAAIAISSYLYFGKGADNKSSPDPNASNTALLDTSQKSPGQVNSNGRETKQPTDTSETPADNSNSIDNTGSTNEIMTPVKQTPGTVAITIQPRGDIYLNNERIAEARTGYNFDLPPGNHSLRIVNTDPDFDSTIIQNFSIKAAETKNYAFSFIKKVLIGHLKVGSWPPKASVAIDGKPQNQLTPTIFPLSPGNYTVRVTLPDQSAFKESTLVVSAGDTVKFAPEFE